MKDKKYKLTPEQFIDFMQKRAREIVEESSALPVYNFDKIQAWKAVEGLILTYKEGNY